MRQSSFLSLGSSGTLALLLAALGCDASDGSSSGAGGQGAGGQGATSSASGSGGAGGRARRAARSGTGGAAGTGGAGEGGGGAAGAGGAGEGGGGGRRRRLGLGRRHRHRTEPVRRRPGHAAPRHHAALSQPEAVARQRDRAALRRRERALSMVPLVETIRAIATDYPSPYPRNIYGESFHTAMGDEITSLVMAAQSARLRHRPHRGRARRARRSASSRRAPPTRARRGPRLRGVAVRGGGDRAARQGGRQELRRRRDRADARRIRRRQRDLRGRMVKLWPSYNQDLLRDHRPVREASRCCCPSSTRSTTDAGHARRRRRRRSGASASTTRAISSASGPKYQYAYVNDHIHLTQPGVRAARREIRAGLLRAVVLGNAWQPLQPTQRRAQRQRHHRALPCPGAAARLGHDAADAAPVARSPSGRRAAASRSGAATRASQISGVAISGDSVQITCATDLPASGLVVGYA